MLFGKNTWSYQFWKANIQTLRHFFFFLHMHAFSCGLKLTEAIRLILHLDLFVHYKRVGAGAHYSPLDKENNDFTLMMEIGFCMSPEAEW